MIRDITAALIAWRDDAHVLAVVVRGMGKEGAFGAFCAGGDIRFFHQAALAGDPALEDFFTEEYALNHLIHTYPKPYIAFMDGIVMGGGMGISQGASLRIVTERSKLAMPETGIGLFPDVGGGYFLSRCPGRLGEYLALTGQVLDGAEALAAGLADAQMDSGRLQGLWESLGQTPYESGEAVQRWCQNHTQKVAARAALRQCRTGTRVRTGERGCHPAGAGSRRERMVARETAALLRKRSPLMLHVPCWSRCAERVAWAWPMNCAWSATWCAIVSSCAPARRAKRWKASAPWRLTRTTHRAGTRRASKTWLPGRSARSLKTPGRPTRTRCANSAAESLLKLFQSWR